MKEDNQSQKGGRFAELGRSLEYQVRVFRNRIAENPNDAEAHKKLGVILSDEKYEKKDYREASAQLNKAIGLGLDGLDIRLRLGAACLKIKEYNEAEKSYRKAIEFDSRCADAHRGLGISLYYLKQFPEAKTSLQKALVLQKELKTKEMTEILAEIHINLAKVAFESKEYKECNAECEEALKLKPDFVQGYIWLGNIRFAQGDYKGAKDMFEKAINLNPKDAEPHYYLGLTFERLNRLDEAEKEYKRAIELNPIFAEANSKLGLLFKTQKRYVEAVSELKKALELQSDLIEAKECLQELTSQPFEKVKEVLEKGKKAISEAESLIKEMDDWHCQSLPGYNEAINEFNKAKDLIKIAHYYSYVETTSSAGKSIEIAKKCIQSQKGDLSEQFYQAKNKVKELLERAKKYKAKKYFPEDYRKLEEEFLQVSNSFTVDTYENITFLLQGVNKLVSNAEEIVSKSYNIFNAQQDLRTESLKQWRTWIKAAFSFLLILSCNGGFFIPAFLGGSFQNPNAGLGFVGLIFGAILGTIALNSLYRKLYPNEIIGRGEFWAGAFGLYIGSAIGAGVGALIGLIASGWRGSGAEAGAIVGTIIGIIISAIVVARQED